MPIFDLHQHFGLGGEECDLFRVPPRSEFDRWIAETGAGAPASAGGVLRALMPPTFYILTNGLEDVRRLNDLAYAVQQAHRADTPAAFGLVEPHHGDAALAEIDRVASELGLTGLVWRHRAHGVFADVPVMTRFVERAAARGLVPVLHVTPMSGNEALWRVWRLAEQFPGVPMVALGALALWDQAEAILANPERAPNLLYEVSELGEGLGTFDRLVARLGAGRLVFGSGAHSIGDARALTGYHRRIAQSDLPDSAKQQILWENAARLLHLPDQ